MSIKKEVFGVLDGKEVYSYTLDNQKGLKAEILTYGGIVRSLVYKGVDVVLGYDTLEEYVEDANCFGAIIGRNSNRLEDAQFELNGKVYKLYPNDERNNLHGGVEGYHKRIWGAEPVDEAEPKLVLNLVSPDGDEGFPGEVKVKVTYTITEDNAISIHYEGETDADTLLNMTNHSYFNLNGHSEGTIDDHNLLLNSDFYTPNNEACMPYGEVLSVKNTPFDFYAKETIGERFNQDSEQIKMFGGFDHNFALKDRGYRLVGSLKGNKTRILMEMYTDRAGVQLYTGNCIDEGCKGKDGAVYGVHSGLCLETQAFPNSVVFSHFPDAILRKDEKYDTTTTYKFK